MDLQTRKLNLISYLTQLQDESVLKKIEGYILKRKEKNNELPFTIDEFVDRIEKSEQDFKNGRFKTQEDLEKISSKW